MISNRRWGDWRAFSALCTKTIYTAGSVVSTRAYESVTHLALFTCAIMFCDNIITAVTDPPALLTVDTSKSSPSFPPTAGLTFQPRQILLLAFDAQTSRNRCISGLAPREPPTT